MGGKGFKKPSHTPSVAVLSQPGVFPEVKPRPHCITLWSPPAAASIWWPLLGDGLGTPTLLALTHSRADRTVHPKGHGTTAQTSHRGCSRSDPSPLALPGHHTAMGSLSLAAPSSHLSRWSLCSVPAASSHLEPNPWRFQACRKGFCLSRLQTLLQRELLVPGDGGETALLLPVKG